MIRIAAALLCMALAAPVAQAQDQRQQIRIQQDAIKASRRLAELQFARDRCNLVPNQTAVDDLLFTAMRGGQLMNVDFVMMTLDERAQSFGIEAICKALLQTHAGALTRQP